MSKRYSEFEPEDLGRRNVVEALVLLTVLGLACLVIAALIWRVVYWPAPHGSGEPRRRPAASTPAGG